MVTRRVLLSLESFGLEVRGERVEDFAEIAVHDEVEPVQRQTDAVIGDAILGIVVGADLFAAIAGADHGTAFVGQRLLLLLQLQSRKDASGERASPLARFLICDFSSWQETTRPVGMCVMRTAEYVVFTDCPPGPEEQNVSMRRSFSLIATSTSSASGRTATVIAEV